MPKSKAKPKPGPYWFRPFGKNADWCLGWLYTDGTWSDPRDGDFGDYATVSDYEPIPTVEELRAGTVAAKRTAGSKG